MKRHISRNMAITAVAFVLAVITICLNMSSMVYAKNNKININGKQYELEAKSKYAYLDGIIPTSIGSTGSQFGRFTIDGDLEEKTAVNGFPAFEVKNGLVTFSYFPSGTVIGAPETDWHLVEDKDSEVNGEKLDKKILKGVVILQSSIDGQNWITDLIDNNIAGEGTNFTADFFETSKIQLINGCFYRVIIAYEVERKLDDKKYLFVKVGNSEQKKYVETYEFYLKDTSESVIAKGAHPNTKKIVGDMTNVINTGKDNGFDKDKGKPITEKDPHFGWKLGEFSLRGYTNTANYQGEEYFLKNLGDAITLTFTLNQKIDCLGGKKNLSIAEDKNGYDANFQVSKTNFKHGTLIVRFTDNENHKSDPIIYTDYLAANAKTGADTRIQFFEEGDYEVAFDYEVKDNSGIDSYTNYKMYFTFKIRNGNNMVYAFDKNGQLADKAWTDSGFTIDKANSHYLTVTVDKYAVVGGVGGKKLDLSWSRTAETGDSFKDGGVYVVTVTNDYQPNGNISKTFYVGNDPYVRAIPVTGKTIEEIVQLIRYTDYDIDRYLLAIDKERKSLEDLVDLVSQGWEIDETGKLIEPISFEPEPEVNDSDMKDNNEIVAETEQETGEKDSPEIDATAPVTEQTTEPSQLSEEESELSSETIIEEDTKEKSNSAPLIVLLAVIASAGGALFAWNKGKKKGNMGA